MLGDIVWRLVDEGYGVMLYEVNPITRELSVRRKVKFKRPFSKEEVFKFVNSAFPKNDQDEVFKAAESLRRAQ